MEQGRSNFGAWGIAKVYSFSLLFSFGKISSFGALGMFNFEASGILD